MRTMATEAWEIESGKAAGVQGWGNMSHCTYRHNLYVSNEQSVSDLCAGLYLIDMALTGSAQLQLAHARVNVT